MEVKVKKGTIESESAEAVVLMHFEDEKTLSPELQGVDKALGGFYRRLRGKVGGLAANVALARKLAQLFYRLLRYGMEYVEKGLKEYEAKVLATETYLLRKLAKKQGFVLIPTLAK